MLVVDVLSRERVSVAGDAEGPVCDKAAALQRLARLLARGPSELTAERILRVLVEREQLQSTGVGHGVAVPHGALETLDRQVGALLVCPQPIPFDAIDGQPVAILFGLIGPRASPGAHLRVLAKVSRMLCNEGFRAELLRARDGADAYALVAATERGGP